MRQRTTYCQRKAIVQCILRDHIADELAMKIADEILESLGFFNVLQSKISLNGSQILSRMQHEKLRWVPRSALFVFGESGVRELILGLDILDDVSQLEAMALAQEGKILESECELTNVCEYRLSQEVLLAGMF